MLKFLNSNIFNSIIIFVMFYLSFVVIYIYLREYIFNIDYFLAKIKFNTKYIYLCELNFDDYREDSISYIAFRSKDILIKPTLTIRQAIKIPYEKIKAIHLIAPNFNINNSCYKNANEIKHIHIEHLLEKYPYDNTVRLVFAYIDLYNKKAFKKSNIFECINEKIHKEKIFFNKMIEWVNGKRIYKY